VVFRIGIIGPESSGKSTLAQALAEHHNARYVPEYARDFVAHLTRPYTYEDVCHIAEQNRREWEAADGLVVYDTELIITRVWMDEVYGTHPDWMNNACPMDAYLLCYPDLTWIPDPTRENGDQARRVELYECYLSEATKTGKPVFIIRGENRLEQAVDFIASFVR